jgi:transposase
LTKSREALAVGEGDGKVTMPIRLGGIGKISAQGLAGKVFHRSFANRRPVAACFGLASSPCNSNTIVRKQGIHRVLLANEVGLGKTIEAGMVLKEYLLRGMAARVLILTPAALVGHWREVMESKFAIACATTHDSMVRSDPERF